MKKTISTLLNILTVVVVVALAALIVLVSVNTKHGKVTTVFGYSFLVVQTGSMEPIYPEKSAVIAQRVDPSELKVGDIISFYSSDPTLKRNVVTHRIKEIKTDDSSIRFLTKGDANVLDDKYDVPASDVVGKVIGKSKVFSFLGRVKQDPRLFFVIIVLPICALITWEIVGFSKKAKAPEHEKKDS